MSTEDAPDLSAELEAALLRELVHRYQWENEQRFGARLRAPVLSLSSVATRLGRWIPATRTLELSRALVVTRPWTEVTSVLEHEMAHQYVDEVLGIHDETAHGESFQRVCAERGIDARAAGAPRPAMGAGVDRALDRVRKLLALAASSNQHEAENAMRRAHELMLRHNIEVAAARGDRDYQVHHLGNPHLRGTRVEAEVLGLLAEFFFVKVIRIPFYLPRLGKRGAVYEISGSASNVEMATHVYEFLLATADRLWRDNRGDARVRSGRDRMSYQAGVVRGFHDKLRGERSELRGVGLVWKGDADLETFYRARHPRIVQRRRMVRVAAAHEAGREAGRSIVLHRPIEHGPGGERRRLGA